jgi:elongation factor 2
MKYKDEITPFENIKYISEPVVTVAIESKNPQDLKQLAKNINTLLIEDPNLSFRIDKNTGQFLLSGMGELHLEININSLRKNQDISLIVSDPIVSYRETILKSSPVVMTKTFDKNNKFWIKVEPLETKVLDLMEKGQLTETINKKEICKTLKNEADYQSEAEKIFAINKNKNFLLNYVKNLPSTLLREGIISGFNWICNMGPLCGEPYRGLKVKLIKIQINDDLNKLILPQVMRAISRAILGASLKASPHLLEPIYKLELSTPNRYLGSCLNIINHRRGKVELTQNKGDNTVITAKIPVAETFGLSDKLRSLTSGYAFWQFFFSKWERIPKNIEKEIIQEVRLKRGMSQDIPMSEKFIDKISKGESL